MPKCIHCPKPIHDRKTQLCDKHYRRFQRHGDINTRYGVPETEENPACIICGKAANVKTRKLCWRHYKRKQRHGDPKMILPKGKPILHEICTIEGCSSPHSAKGFCANHYTVEQRKKIRHEVLIAYGGKCACCEETAKEFLAIDHINGDGYRQRKEKGIYGSTMYAWLKRNKFPKDNYRLLCHNCNQAKGIYGYCPHERVKPPQLLAFLNSLDTNLYRPSLA
jgi:hypothetical protein